MTHIILFAQKNNSSDSLQTSDPKEKTSLTLAGLYGNNIDYYGQVADQQLPYIALNATIRWSVGPYFSATTYHLLSDSLLVSATTLGIGYDHKFTSAFSGSLGYFYTFFPSNSPFLQATSPNLASANLTYQHLFKTEADIDGSFGKDFDYFVTLTNSKDFDFTISDHKAILSITPELAVIAGTQQYYQQYLTRKQKKNNGSEGNPNGNNNLPPGQTVLTTTDFKKFGLLSYHFKLPVSYNRAHYMIEAAYKLSLLGNNAINKGDLNSFFTLGIYYQF